MKMVGRYPRLDEDACVGCGLCAYHCEATPTAISITPFAAIVSRREIK
jgi:ferredoxin